MASHGKQQVWLTKSQLSIICRGVYPQQKIEKTGIGGRKTGGKKKYDKESRERRFLPQWTKDRSWLALAAEP